MSISIKDIAWTAGFLEGEGNFYLGKRGPGYPYKSGGTFNVNACQVQKEPPERLKNLFSGSICVIPARPVNHKPYFKWTLSGVKAAGLMMTIFTLMSPKRKEQIKKALDEWKKTSPHIKKVTCPKGHPYEEPFLYEGRKKRRRCRICKREAARRYREKRCLLLAS